MIKALQKIIDTYRTHRTSNTRLLDDKFDPTAPHQLRATLGKVEFEILASRLLEEAKHEGNFVAVPLSSSKLRDTELPSAANYIPQMIELDYLVLETLPTGLEVVSMSEKAAHRMYKVNKSGNPVNTHQFSKQELKEDLPIKDLVSRKYFDWNQ